MDNLVNIIETILLPYFYDISSLTDAWQELLHGILCAVCFYIVVYVILLLPFKFFKKLIKDKK